MPRTKRITRKEVEKAKGTATDLAIEDRLTRSAKGDMDSVVHLGRVVENLLKGEAGAILKALTAGRISRELAGNRDGHLSADRVLGRLEMCDILWNDLEQFVLDKDHALAPKKNDEAVEFFNYSPM